MPWSLAAGRACAAPAPASSAPVSLSIGFRDPAVLWLQLRLTALGLYSGPVTGYFGTQTQAAVRAFQRARGLAVSGVVGSLTSRELGGMVWRVPIRKGDTLAAVAQRYGCTVADLLKANPQVSNPDRVYAGQMLTIPVPAAILALVPSGGGTAGDASVPATATGLVTQAPKVHADQAGQGTTAPVAPKSLSASVVTPLRVALTFNDGPDPAVLPAILEVLKAHCVPATFFFTGKEMSDHPEIVREVLRLGHAVESHGWRHEPMVGLTEARIGVYLADTARVIADLTGGAPKWFRPPGGAVDQAVAAAAARAEQQLLWWHNIGPLPTDAATVTLMDRYLFDGAVIMLPAADASTATYLGPMLERWIWSGACFCRLDEPLGITWGW
ncbi:MAG: polysaccharide deacetylase family protein [Bacillota bacterium]|nr:polysaccharide deacetylase family protein [Bacillota bacterium]